MSYGKEYACTGNTPRPPDAGAIQLAKAEIRVTGLDLSADMLAVASEKTTAGGLEQPLRLECGDMRSFDLAGREFGLVICRW